MNYEAIAIIATILATGSGLAALILPNLSRIHRDIAELRERMARLEGLFEGFTGRTAQ